METMRFLERVAADFGVAAGVSAASLVQQWLPAVEGAVGKLTRGASVADVGCGHGLSTILMAQAFPRVYDVRR